jgi:hypothetical protein
VTESRDPGALRGKAGEHITVIVLLLIAGFLGYLRFVVLPAQAQADGIEFAYENPLLETEPGDCVGGQAALEPGREKCFVVTQRVERPASGPEHVPGYEDLRRLPAYVVLEMRTVSDQAGCGGDVEEVVLRGMNNFGLDPISQVSVQSIRPVWMRYAGREGVLYEVVMIRYDVPSQYTMYISPEMPVMGLVKQERYTETGPAESAYFREIACPR